MKLMYEYLTPLSKECICLINKQHNPAKTKSTTKYEQELTSLPPPLSPYPSLSF